MDLKDFINTHQLTDRYLASVEDYFFPVIKGLAVKKDVSNNPLIIGINGAQGSGKTTLADLMRCIFGQQFKLNVVVLSLDDFYYTRAQRQKLADTIHPLLLTRGVPGTHDIDLAVSVIEQLKQGSSDVAIPRFDKAMDDRKPKSQWDSVDEPVDIIIIEGWCLGATAQTQQQLLMTVNDLEKQEDADLRWRHYVNQQLMDTYPKLFDEISCWLMLKAPSFDCVFQWRLEQENKSRASAKQHELVQATHVMDEVELSRFIQFYQRITEQMLRELPDKVDYLLELDEQRQVVRLINSRG